MRSTFKNRLLNLKKLKISRKLNQNLIVIYLCLIVFNCVSKWISILRHLLIIYNAIKNVNFPLVYFGIVLPLCDAVNSNRFLLKFKKKLKLFQYCQLFCYKYLNAQLISYKIKNSNQSKRSHNFQVILIRILFQNSLIKNSRYPSNVSWL